jgi:hypothetical protein
MSAALELLEPLEPYLSDNVLNGAKRLNVLNDLNGPIPMMNGRTLGGLERAALELLEPMEPNHVERREI